MGLADWFTTFCSTIRVQDGGTISARYKRITKRLNSDFWNTDSETSHSLYVGSFGRNTAIHGISDLDMVFELPASEYRKYNAYSVNGQSSLLQAVRTSLSSTYSVSPIGADGQIVAIKFDDGIVFEIVPVFANTSGTYTHPDSNAGGSWKATNPRAEMNAFQSRNAETNGNLVQLGRMMRAWKQKWSVPIKGLLIDTLAYQFIESWGHRDKSFVYYDYMCRDFFKWMSDQDKNQDFWRAPGSGSYVYAGKGQFQYKATQCFNIANSAIAHETRTVKEEWSAKQKWREVFGTDFPS